MKALPTIGIAATLLAGAVPGVAAQDWNWKGSVAAGKQVEIKGVNGSIRASAAPGNEVVVQAVKKGRKSDPSTVQIEVVKSDDGVTICAVYPSTGKRKNSCAPGDEGHMSTNDNDVTVDFTVQVPAGVNFVGETVNGSVATERLGANASVATVNGDVRVVAAGQVEANTVNGSIDVTMGKADWTGTMAMSTVNGSIRATLPPSFSARVKGSTVNGSIETAFPLTIQGRFGPRSVDGTIGSGGRTLELSTVNGSITLAKGS